jgi:hypothetical protein
VNRAGKQGHNKPADLQQENNIKMVKNVFKFMGAGKLSNKALVRASRAAPAINTIAQRFQDDFKIHVPLSVFEHSKKNNETDKILVRDCLKKEKPFEHVDQRTIGLKTPLQFFLT